MAFLTINGRTVPVLTAGMSESPDHTIGSATHGADGQLRGDISGVKLARRFRTPPMSEADIAAVIADAPPGRFASCSGDVFGGLTVRCTVAITGFDYFPTADGFRRGMQLVLKEA